ncbi:MAG: type II secretion system protein [Phycisphaerae bacterium]|nr:type II secretion system protein [Phycisphaerae bacterium]
MMNRKSGQTGFTLMELLVVAAIVMILASALVGVGRRLLTTAQEKLARSTIDIVVTAIEQYRSELNQFPMEYLNSMPRSVTPAFAQADLIAYLNDDLGLIRMVPAKTVTISSSVENNNAVGECLYYFLNKLSASRRMIDTIADSQKTSFDTNGKPRQANYTNATGQEVTIVLIRLMDPWNSTLRYEFTPGTMSFPRITSAGPDRTFDTPDDLRSDE